MKHKNTWDQLIARSTYLGLRIAPIHRNEQRRKPHANDYILTPYGYYHK